MIEFLKAGKIFKLICGVGNFDIHQIETLTRIFSLAGCRFFDVSCIEDTIKAAKRGMNRDGYICASIGLGDDVHLKKAHIDKNNCQNCKKCIKICPQNAIFDFKIDEKKCIGCQRCKKVCEFGCITFHNTSFDLENSLKIAKKENVDCLELHCSIADKSLIIEAFDYISRNFNKTISISIDRSKLGDDELLLLLEDFSKKTQPLIIQAEGRPVTGGENTFCATLQTVAFAELIIKREIPAFVFLSGGVNEKSYSLIKSCGLEVSGISMGSYARKFFKEFLDKNLEKEPKLLEKAVKIAENLIKNSFE